MSLKTKQAMADRSSPAQPWDLRGVVLGERYRIVDLLASGGMGHIYRAVQLPLGRLVALKVLRPHTIRDARDPTAPQRFLREAATLARLSHPNTVTIYDYGETEVHGVPTFYMAMELVPGLPLHVVMHDEGAFEEERALRIVWEVARAMRQAHRESVVHRDLKPSNIMLTRTDQGESVKVLDFGIAKLLTEDFESLTLDNRVVGSPRYMSPEQILQQEVDGRADIYALGVVLFEMLTGQPPFHGGGASETMIAHVKHPVPCLRGPGGCKFTTTTESIVRRCLAKDPDDRYQDVSELMFAIRTTCWVGAEADTPEPAETEISLVTEVMTALQQTGVKQVWKTQARFAAAGFVAMALVAAGGWAGQVVEHEQDSTTEDWASADVTHGESMRFAEVVNGAERGEVERDIVVSTGGELGLIKSGSVAEGSAWIRLESDPVGASVWEGNARLGDTPLRVVVDRQRQSHRVFELRKEGYLATPLAWASELAGSPGVVQLKETPYVHR